MTAFADFDPFSDDIVREPRSIEVPIESLNAHAVARLLAVFEEVDNRKRRVCSSPHVQLVTSPEPGYGKSHLIGRLFRRLEGRATLIYLRPFQDPESCWIQILDRMIGELDRPDRPDTLVLGPEDQTQLTVLARKILEGLAGRLIVAGELPPAAVPSGASRTDHDAVWKSWMAEHFGRMLDALDRSLAGAGVQVHPNRRAWLRVLYAYAFLDHTPNARQVCLDWLQVQPLDFEEVRQIGLRRSDLAPVDLPRASRNDECFVRVRDLLRLGASYRPFLFCFDQTELYGASPELARAFGVVLSRLHRECVNHLVIATGNRHVWDQKVSVHFEKADQHVVAPEPVRLEGMKRSQAAELLQHRLDWVPERRPEFAGPWLDGLFATTPELSVREVLRRASQHWNRSQRLPPPKPIEELFQTYRRNLIAQPKRMAFDAGVFQWAAEKVLSPAARAEAVPIKSARGYLTLRWDSPEESLNRTNANRRIGARRLASVP